MDARGAARGGDAGAGPAGRIRTDVPPPAASGQSNAPGHVGVVLLARADGTLTANWNAVAGATRYHVTYTTDNTKSWHAPVDDHTNVAANSLTFSADNAKTYVVGVRAGNDHDQWSGWVNSDPIDPIDPGQAPPAVTKFWTERVCDHKFKVRWQKVDGATGYDLNVSLNHRKSWKRLRTNHNAKGYQVTHWNVNKTYWFAIRSVNAHGTSAWTNLQSVAPPCAVEELSARYAGNGDVSVSWNPAARADDGYHVNFSADNGKSWQRMTSNLNAAAYTFNKDPAALPYNPNFLVAVQSKRGELSSEWRNAPVQDEAALTASNVASTTATLTIANWTGQWWYQADAAPHTACQGPVAAGTSTKDLTGLTSGGTYTYSAYSASGCAEANQLASAAPFTTGVVSVSNLDETANDTGVGITSAFTEATGFTTGNHGDGYRLRSVTIKSGAATGSPGDFTAAIHAASGGNPAASATYTLSGGRPTAAGNHAYTCAGACQLSDNTTYFLVLSMGSASSSAGADSGAGIASSADSYVWNVTDSDDETNSPSAAGWSIANTAKYQRNVTWTDEADGATGMFKVTATENPSLSAGSITTTGATLAMANYAGDWHYKADVGPDTACQGPVSATTQTVTGLTSGRTYTYSAYRASGCADADLVATVEFAAGPVSVSNLDEASHQYGWWVGRQESLTADRATSFTTGGATGGYTLTEVTISLKLVHENPFNVHAKIYTDASGVPGTLVKDLGGKNPRAGGNYTWTCSGNGCDLSPNTTYHLALEASAPNSGIHYYDLNAAVSQNETNTPSDAGWTISSSVNTRQNGLDWTTFNNTDPIKFKVAALTNPGLAASGVTARGATLTMSDHGGSWYYQADAAPHTTCRGPVSTTTQALSGLSPSTTYTYTAYSASGCADTSKLAAADPFTTLASGVSVSNLGETARANGIEIIAGSPEATGFTAGSHATGYTLQSVVIKAGASVGNPGNFTAAIHAASAGNPAGSATHTLSGDNPTAAGEHSFTFATSQTQTCLLSKDATYFLALSGTSASYSDGYYVWEMTDSNTQTNTPSNAGWSIADAAKYQRNNAWKDESGFSGLFKVIAEENPVLSAGSITTTEATLTLTHYTGAWWYKATTGPHTTCQGPVATNTSTKDISGLTTSQTYTYSAYGASGCAAANLLATAATFTTGVVSVDNLGLVNHNYCPVGGASAGATKCANMFTTGGAAGGYTLNSVTAEFRAKSGNPGTFSIALYEASGSNPGNAVADATLSGSNAPGSAGSHTYTCTGAGCRLSANTDYYVVMSASATSDGNHFRWQVTATLGQTKIPPDNGWIIDYVAIFHNNNSWKTYTGYGGKYKLVATINPGLAASSVTAITATLTISDHNEAWWYERTAPGGDATCHRVAAGTKTASLSSLTASASYTYKAYDKAGCNAADELATVTFTTAAS